jgi:hypothetical protein
MILDHSLGEMMAKETIGPLEVETSGDIGVVTLRRADESLAEEIVLDRSEWVTLRELFRTGSFDHI